MKKRKLFVRKKHLEKSNKNTKVKLKIILHKNLNFSFAKCY